MGKRQPRMIFQTQGGHYAAITMDKDVTPQEIDIACFHHFSHPEQPGTYLTTILKADNNLLTYHSRKPGW